MHNSEFPDVSYPSFQINDCGSLVELKVIVLRSSVYIFCICPSQLGQNINELLPGSLTNKMKCSIIILLKGILL